MDKLLGDIDALKACFMTGGRTETACPPDWQGFDDLSLLALTGQFTRIATRPASGADIALRPEIPALDLPPLAENLRPQLRRALEAKMVLGIDLIRLLASRGFGVNPVDWMPKRADTDLPPAYDAWLDWLENMPTPDAQDDLSAETWDEFPAHSRHRDLTALHGTNAEAARGIVTEIAPGLAADQRLRMLECLRANLTDGDKELLESFANDRSAKVKSFTRVQLARLGADASFGGQAAQELPDYIEVGRAGILSRRKIILGRKLKNDAQRKRRRKVFGQISLHDLASAVDVSPDDFVEMWELGHATDEVADVVAVSGTDHQVERLVERIMEDTSPVPQALMDRLTPARRTQFGLRVLMDDDWRLTETRQWCPAPETMLELGMIAKVKALPELIKLAADPEQANQDHLIADALHFLGLISTREAAEALLEQLLAAGVMSVDPRLTILRLNAAL